MPRGERGLVRLEVADQLPADRRRGLGPLFDPLLHPVLPHRPQAEAGGVFDGGGRMLLGDGQQLDFARARAPAAAAAAAISARTPPARRANSS